MEWFVLFKKKKKQTKKNNHLNHQKKFIYRIYWKVQLKFQWYKSNNLLKFFKTLFNLIFVIKYSFSFIFKIIPDRFIFVHNILKKKKFLENFLISRLIIIVFNFFIPYLMYNNFIWFSLGVINYILYSQ